jgi:hypothetical protein
MKIVFTEEEVAAALQKSVAEFATLRPKLENLGFPRPIAGLGDRWAIMDVINWVNDQGERMAFSSAVPNYAPLPKHKLS